MSTEPQVYRCGNQSHSLGATQRGCDGTQRRHPWAGCWVAWWLFGRILRMSGPQEIATLRGGGRSGKRGPRRAPSPRTLCGKPAWGAEKPPLFPGRSARATAALGLGLRFSCVEAEVRILVKVPKNLQCCRNLGPVLGPAVSVGSWRPHSEAPDPERLAGPRQDRRSPLAAARAAAAQTPALAARRVWARPRVLQPRVRGKRHASRQGGRTTVAWLRGATPPTPISPLGPGGRG